MKKNLLVLVMSMIIMFGSTTSVLAEDVTEPELNDEILTESITEPELDEEVTEEMGTEPEIDEGFAEEISTEPEVDQTESGKSEFKLKLQVDNPVMNVNGVEKEIDAGKGTAPVIKSGRTLVPIRAIVEAMGGKVGWTQETQTATLTYDGIVIDLIINSNTAYVDGVEKTIDVAPEIMNGRTMLPIRFIAETFDFDVQWEQETLTVIITKQEESELAVHFIDVGQGDSIFIELPNDETMLIDAGITKYTAKEYIEDLGYEKITYVVATHPDSDHITGMSAILDSFEVGVFYMPDKPATTKVYENMITSLAENGCESEYAIGGKTIVNEDFLDVRFVAPVAKYKDNNNSSAVIKLTYMDASFLFTGDAEKKAEEDIVLSLQDIDVDVLKVGHHGSDSSTTEIFMRRVTPLIAVISVGKDNKYDHPADQTVEILERYGADIYRTDESGSIIITVDDGEYSVEEHKSAENPTDITLEPEYELNTEPDENKELEDVTIYKTKTGSKYHLDECSSLGKSKIEITYEQAIEEGLEPCGRCNPPRPEIEEVISPEKEKDTTETKISLKDILFY